MLPHEEVFNLAIEKGVSLSKFDQSSGDTWINYMIKIGVRPSVHTYNALLRTIDLSTSVNYKQKIVRDTLAHMSSNKIQPDMTTYWLVLSAFDPNKQPTRQQVKIILLIRKIKFCSNIKENYKISLRPPINILSEILKKLESLLKNSNPLEISEPTDQEFFIQAMSIACRATNVSIADRIEKLYKSPQNRIRMTSFIKESEYFFSVYSDTLAICYRFYEYYLLLKLENSSPLDGLELYRTIIPGLVLIFTNYFNSRNSL